MLDHAIQNTIVMGMVICVSHILICNLLEDAQPTVGPLTDQMRLSDDRMWNKVALRLKKQEELLKYIMMEDDGDDVHMVQQQPQQQPQQVRPPQVPAQVPAQVPLAERPQMSAAVANKHSKPLESVVLAYNDTVGLSFGGALSSVFSDVNFSS